MESDSSHAEQPASLSPGTQSITAITADEVSPDANSNRWTQADVASSEAEELDSFNLIEPPPLDWRSDTSSEVGSVQDVDDPTFPPSGDNLEEEGLDEFILPLDVNDIAVPPVVIQQQLVDDNTDPIQAIREGLSTREVERQVPEEEEAEVEGIKSRSRDEDHTRIHALLNRLQLMGEESDSDQLCPARRISYRRYRPLELEPEDPSAVTGVDTLHTSSPTETTGLLFLESHHRDLLGLLESTEIGPSPLPQKPRAAYLPRRAEVDAVVSVSYNQEDAQKYWDHFGNGQQPQLRGGFSASLLKDRYPEPVWMKCGEEPPEVEGAAENELNADDRPDYKDVPGPCDPDDLLDGVIFGAKYLGSTQIKSEKNPSTNARMAQAQEAVDRIKAPEGESQPMTEVDLFISTQRIKVLSTDTQEAMMDHSLQMISYIADIGSIVVLMARRKPNSRKGHDSEQTTNSSSSSSPGPPKKCWMICHVFSSDDAQIIAQAIGQAFGVAYQQFLQANGIKPSELRPGEYSDYLGTQELYNGDLVHFSDSQNIRDVIISKAAGEILGLAVVESGWGSILPTVVVANLLHGGPAERSGELSIGDRIMSVNGTSLVGLPIASCQSIIRDLKSQTCVKLSIVHCPPVTMAIIKRPDPKFQLGFSVEDGIICSLMRGGIAERGGIRVGHRIIEINGQSVVATPHDKIIHILTNAIGEIHLKTMPASTYRLLTGQEQPVFL
ncbi:amyloid-beta A4 precursor protein-binding family A member 3 [Lampris incognitus]|uniref:amyloid-beta A4 precursor protein-binding family A member 3 n=1 Tax=Lampris incognitus TaxID=2546036 RepID=UPI0024B5A4D7|nr:amyloid-beta A4 precursor protein-binding family A member 3 [Lampris incognitus]